MSRAPERGRDRPDEQPGPRRDGVFDFGIVYHVPDWRAALRDVHRVLRPGGGFYAEEVFERFIVNPWRRLLEHPQHDRFDRDRFCEGLSEAGFRLVANRTLWGSFGWFVADRESA